MTKHDPKHFAKAFNIPSLDGIRAISVLIVFISHDQLQHIVPGFLGVAVFFFLSGYLITTLMRLEIERTGTIAIGHFYLRRAFRILPPFYLVLALICLIVRAGWLRGSCGITDMMAASFYVTNYWTIFVHQINMPGFTVFWSLSVEEHFYLIFPFLMLLLIRLKIKPTSQASLLLSICAAILIWRCILVYHFHILAIYNFLNEDPFRTWYATDTRADSILFGCVLALWGNPIFGPTPKHVGKLAVVGAFVILGTLLYRDPNFRETFRYTLQGAAMIPLFIAAIRFHDHWAFRWLNTGPVRFGGVLSYSLYLTHVPIIALCEKWSSDRLIVGLTALSICMVVAIIIHVLVERPLARVRRRLGSGNLKPLDHSAAETATAQYAEVTVKHIPTYAGVE